MTPTRHTSGPVFEYLWAHPGEIVNITEIQDATGLDRKQVQAAVYNLEHRDHHTIERVGNYAYRYHQALAKPAQTVPDPPTKRLFEEIGETKDGSVILQDEVGNLYRASAL